MALEHEMLMRQAGTSSAHYNRILSSPKSLTAPHPPSAAETRALLLASRAPSNPPSARSVSDTGSISSSANRHEPPAILPIELALPREDSGESDSDAERCDESLSLVPSHSVVMLRHN